MKARDLLERVRRIAASRGALTGRVTLFDPDAEDHTAWRTVDLDRYPPGPERDRLLAGHVVLTDTQDDWVDRLAKEDEEAKNATA